MCQPGIFLKQNHCYPKILYKPSFPESELGILKQIQQQQLQINEQKNNIVASKQFRSKLYHGSPYGHIMTKEANKIRLRLMICPCITTSGFMETTNVFLTGKFDEAIVARIQNLINGVDVPETSHAAGFENRFASQPHFETYIARDESVQSCYCYGEKMH